ncbi:MULTISPECIES: hypothetical protein [Pandoraea]|uniref:hypothetical protein n=1 Tax=Pandoraea TaxID=93217 RepID=UPI001F5D02AB|nr:MULTISPECIES: hypothetical protein [Pandoraea]
MNWRRLYATCQRFGAIFSMALGASGCWGFLIAGGCRIAFGIDEDDAMLFIGLPIFVILFFVYFKKLPKTLLRSGMLSDDPSRFGPWFK